MPSTVHESMLKALELRKPDYSLGLRKAVDLLAPHVTKVVVLDRVIHLSIGGAEYTLDVGQQGAEHQHPIVHLWLTLLSHRRSLMVLDNVDIFVNQAGDMEVPHFDMLGLLVGDYVGHSSTPAPTIPYT